MALNLRAFMSIIGKGRIDQSRGMDPRPGKLRTKVNGDMIELYGKRILNDHRSPR